MRIVLKIGSSSLVNSNRSINNKNIEKLIDVIYRLRLEGHEVLLVTSGAVAVGMNKLSLDKKPKDISLKQACAAIGQVSLMETYEKYCMEKGFLCAQILLSRDDFENRERMVNLTNTIEELFSNKVLPIVNENDAITIHEIKVGDNDTLSAQLVPMTLAKVLILISDIDGLYDKNPKEYSDAKLIREVASIDEDTYKMAGDKITNVGTGGIRTKLHAASIATSAGANMYIVSSNNLDNVISAVHGDFYGTKFLATDKYIPLKMHWLIYKTLGKGSLYVDDGAKEALLSHKSLLPMGITGLDGKFLKDSVVYIKDKKDEIIAKGIVNYSSDEIKLIKGKKIAVIKDILGYIGKDEVVHASDMIIMAGEDYGKSR